VGLDNEHAVAVGEKTVFFFDGFGVGFEDELAVGKGGDKHDEGALREMKICQEGIDDLKLVGWVDKDIRVTRGMRDFWWEVVGVDFESVAREAFEHAGAGGARGDHPAAGVKFGFIDSVGGFFCHREPFGVHVVLLNEVGFYGAECAYSYVEGEKGVVDFREDFGGKMETRGGSGDGSFFLGEGGLVAIAVGAVAFAIHVVRQGELAVGFFIDFLVPADDAVAIFENAFDGAGGVANFNRASGFHFFAGTDEAFPFERAEFVGAYEFDFVVVGKEAGGGDLGVVKDK